MRRSHRRASTHHQDWGLPCINVSGDVVLNVMLPLISFSVNPKGSGVSQEGMHRPASLSHCIPAIVRSWNKILKAHSGRKIDYEKILHDDCCAVWIHICLQIVGDIIWGEYADQYLMWKISKFQKIYIFVGFQSIMTNTSIVVLSIIKPCHELGYWTGMSF